MLPPLAGLVDIETEKRPRSPSSIPSPIPSTTPSTTPPLTSSVPSITVSVSRDLVKDAVRDNLVLFDVYGKHGVLPVSIEKLVDTINKYQQMATDKTIETVTVPRQGVFNYVISATSAAERPRWMTAKNYAQEVSTPNGFVFRWTKLEDDPRYNPKKDHLIEELYMTLYASHRGVGPSVYAAAINDTGDQLFLMLSGGRDTELVLGQSHLAPELLYESCKLSSEAGLLLLDIKPSNTITITEDGGVPKQVQMIDFGSDFTFQMFDANNPTGANAEMATSLLVLNLSLLISYMKCWGGFLPSTITSLFSMMEELDPTVSTLSAIVEDINIPERWRICHAKKIGGGDDCEYINLNTVPSLHSSGVTTDEKYKQLAVKYVFMVCHYVLSRRCAVDWWKFDENKTMMQQLRAWLKVSDS